jgi:hypothetical protein
MVLMMARQEGWTTIRQWPKTLKTKLNLKVDYQAQIHLDLMILVMESQGD